MGINHRQFVTCDFDDAEIEDHVWIEVSSGGDSFATFGDYADAKIPGVLCEGMKTFCGVPHMAEWFREQAP